MEYIKFKSGGHDAEKNSGNVPIFGYGIKDTELGEDASCSFLPNVFIGGLEMLTVAFLLLILYNYFPVNSLVYILVPYALNFFLATIVYSSVEIGMNVSVKMPGCMTQCCRRISVLRLDFLFFIFAAKCALIYMYSKNLSEVVRVTGSLEALANITVDQTLDVTVPTDYSLISFVCIWFITIAEFLYIVIKCIPLIHKISDKVAIRHIYRLALSLVDTLGSSIFLLIHRWMEYPNEGVHFSQIINHLPLLITAVAAARCVVWFFIPFIFARKEDRRGIYLLAFIHLCVAAANAFFYKWTDFGIFLTLKLICFTAMAERFLMLIVNVYLGSCKRQARL